MLIGCCHCGPTLDPPSESIPSDSSQSQDPSVSASTSHYDYGACGCTAVPITWEIVWPAMHADAACPIDAGVYELHRTIDKGVPGGSLVACNWEAGLQRRMKIDGGVWTCTNGTIPLFRIMVNPTAFAPSRINLWVAYAVWKSTGLGVGYVETQTNYQTATGINCIHNGAMSSGGSSVTWPNKTDVVLPPTYVAMPLPSTISIRPKL